MENNPLPLHDQEKLVELLKKAHNEAFLEEGSSSLSTLNAQMVALALLWDDIQENAPQFHNLSLSQKENDEESKWFLSFVTNSKSPNEVSHTCRGPCEGKLIIVTICLDHDLLKSLTNIDVEGQDFPHPFFHQCLPPPIFEKFRQLSLLAKNIDKEHEYIHPFLSTFDVGGVVNSFSFPSPILPSKLSLISKEFPEVFEKILNNILKTNVRQSFVPSPKKRTM